MFTRRDGSELAANDFLDHPRDTLAFVHPLLVLRRDELGEQSERDELDADDLEEYAEEEQRARTDALPPEPEHREVEQDDEADGAHEQPDPAEEVERAVPVTPHERDA